MQTVVRELFEAPAPADALRHFCALPYPLLLESAATNPETGRYSFVMADPFQVLRDTVDASDLAAAADPAPDPLTRLRAALAAHREPTIPDLPPFQGGAAGYLGYDLCRALERLPRHRVNDLSLPDIVLGFYDWTLAWDHEKRRCWLISTGLPEAGADRERRARDRAEVVLDLLTSPPSPAREGPGNAHRERSGFAPSHPLPTHPEVSSGFTADDYVTTVARVREYIVAGDIFQANLSQRLQAPLSITPLELYHRLRENSPAPYAAFFDIGEAALVSSSPELFLRVRGREVETRPIKGTAPRHPDSVEDSRLASSLATSEKDRAENVMIVDLLRNDLSLVCEDASVQVTRLCAVESHGPVHHLVSTVVGELRADRDVVDLLRAAFPGGSITGAPKIRAMEIIAELEPTQRGPYTGSIGYIGFDGAVETSIVIRTFVVKEGVATFQVGGGIVADSDPQHEYQETLNKAAGMLAALEAPAWF